jgi:hypothetical protein
MLGKKAYIGNSLALRDNWASGSNGCESSDGECVFHDEDLEILKRLTLKSDCRE